MFILKNINDGSIGQFFNLQGEDWLDITNLPEGLEYLLSAAKTAKLNQLNKNRENFCLIPVEYQGKTYATTIYAISAVTHYNSILSSSGTGVYYTYPQKEEVNLTKAEFKAIATLIQDREINSRRLRDAKETEINNASSIEELNSINIDFV